MPVSCLHSLQPGTVPGMLPPGIVPKACRQKTSLYFSLLEALGGLGQAVQRRRRRKSLGLSIIHSTNFLEAKRCTPIGMWRGTVKQHEDL